MTELEKSILLVEDDNGDAALLERAFRKAGIKTTMMRVTNGEAAIDYLKRAALPGAPATLPDLMILDLKLPLRSGFEVLEWLRRVPLALRRMPVVVLSSSSEPEDVNRAYELGANSYLAKPQTTQQFFEMAIAFRDYWLDANHDPSLSLNSPSSSN